MAVLPRSTLGCSWSTSSQATLLPPPSAVSSNELTFVRIEHDMELCNVKHHQVCNYHYKTCTKDARLDTIIIHAPHTVLLLELWSQFLVLFSRFFFVLSCIFYSIFCILVCLIILANFFKFLRLSHFFRGLSYQPVVVVLPDSTMGNSWLYLPQL